MIATSARVITIANGTAQVEPTAQSGCGGCKTSSSCAVSGLGKYFSNNRKTIEVKCDASVRAGDELHMTMSEADFLKAGVLAYLLPSLFTIIGAGLAATLNDSDVGAVAGAALGFASGLLLVRLLAWVPRMTVRQVNGLFNEGDAP
ncbi:MAG: SoxR reducing system RseC family protein [Gallionella sp.]|jgi:sigma-E factor negative regulatory protein RseC